jgi:cyclophilin family peptidyl-prolyl cis-trans isomerase
LTRADKSPRKQAARQEQLAQAQAAQRRQRLITVGVLVLIALVIGIMLLVDGDEESAVADECWSDAARGPGQRTYSEPPQMVIEDATDYSAVVSTSEGDFTMDLLEGDAPETVNNFVCLARDDFYDGLIWHRVEKNLVIQTGDPQGTGEGGPGYEISDELPEGGENLYTFGAVGMANAGPNTGGSQWFVVVTDPDPKGGFDPAGFPPSYPIFGRVDPEDEASTETLVALAGVKVQGGTDPATAARPVDQVLIEDIEIEES